VFAWLLILKGVFRSVVEIWRDDDRGVFFGGYLSTSQLISIPLVAAGVWLLAKKGQAAASVQPAAA
jgi:prolipoprotein diacylglyceryltransferase